MVTYLDPRAVDSHPIQPPDALPALFRLPMLSDSRVALYLLGGKTLLRFAPTTRELVLGFIAEVEAAGGKKDSIVSVAMGGVKVQGSKDLTIELEPHFINAQSSENPDNQVRLNLMHRFVAEVQQQLDGNQIKMHISVSLGAQDQCIFVRGEQTSANKILTLAPNNCRFEVDLSDNRMPKDSFEGASRMDYFSN